MKALLVLILLITGCGWNESGSLDDLFGTFENMAATYDVNGQIAITNDVVIDCKGEYTQICILDSTQDNFSLIVTEDFAAFLVDNYSN